MAVLLAAIIAALVPLALLLAFASLAWLTDMSVSVGGLEGLVWVGGAVTVVSAAMVLLLGVPAFLLLRRWQRANCWTMALAGALLASLLALAVGWPRTMPGLGSQEYWHGQYVRTYLDGEPTRYVWYQLAESAGAYALLGMATALVFYAVWRWLAMPDARNKSK